MKLLREMGTKGFTMVEVIVTLVIIGIISGPIFYLYFDTQKDYIIAQNKITAQSNMNAAMKAIVDDLRGVESVQYKDGANDIPSIQVLTGSGNYTASDTGSTAIGIVMRTTDKGGNDKKVAYVLIGTTIYKFKDANIVYDNSTSILTLNGSGEMILDNVDTFNIEKNNNDVGYIITITAKPKQVGNTVPNAVTITNKFVPRYSIY